MQNHRVMWTLKNEYHRENTTQRLYMVSEYKNDWRHSLVFLYVRSVNKILIDQKDEPQTSYLQHQHHNTLSILQRCLGPAHNTLRD